MILSNSFLIPVRRSTTGTGSRTGNEAIPHMITPIAFMPPVIPINFLAHCLLSNLYLIYIMCYVRVMNIYTDNVYDNMSTTQTQEIFDSLIVKTKLENAKCFFNNCKALAEIDVKHTISDNHKNKAEGRIKAYNKAIKQVDQILKEFTN